MGKKKRTLSLGNRLKLEFAKEEFDDFFTAVQRFDVAMKQQEKKTALLAVLESLESMTTYHKSVLKAYAKQDPQFAMGLKRFARVCEAWAKKFELE